MLDLTRYSELKTAAIQIQATAKSKFNSAQNLKVQFDEETEKLENEKKTCITQSVSIDTLKEIMDKLSQQYISKVVDLLSYALSVIFYDKKYSVEIQVSDQRNVKTADMYLVETLDDGEVLRSSFNDSIGGGVIAVCGLVLQVYFCNVLQQAPILFLDEQLSQVSAEYTETLMSFIKELADAKGLIMVLVSHDDRYMSFADKKYSVVDGEVKEVVVNGGNTSR